MNANELMNAWIENSKSALEPMRALGQVNQHMLEAVSKQQVELTKQYMDFGARNLKLMTSVREPRALIDEQLSLAKEFGDKLLADAEVYAKLAKDYREQLSEWSEKTTEAAVKSAGEAVDKAEKAVKDAA